MPGPDFLSFFPYGVFWGRFFLATLARLHKVFNIIITFVVTMFIIKVGYGVTPRPYPIFSRICWLFSFLVFVSTFGKCRMRAWQKYARRKGIGGENLATGV